MNSVSRRKFIKNAGTMTAGLTIVSSNVLGKKFGHTAPSDKLNIAGVGIGGHGFYNLTQMKTENIVALCDVDWDFAKKAFDNFPDAKRYKDWRVMLDEFGKHIDAIVVATPDHTHAIISAHAITMSKHCFTQKPLTHSVYESRLLTKLARKYKVATQMGNQGNSGKWPRQVAEWIQSGIIGDVYEVHCWSTSRSWPQSMENPEGGIRIPKNLDWDLWIGPAKKRPFDKIYVPRYWRGFWDFGTGSLGDTGPHVMDPVWWALDLKYPIRISTSSTLFNIYSPPDGQVVKYIFPERPPKEKIKMPELTLFWYDGGLLPPRPEELRDGEMMGDNNGGIIFIGTRGKIMTDCYGTNPILLPKSAMNNFKEPEPIIPRIEGSKDTVWGDSSHYQDWIRACKESSENRIESSSNFQFSGPFNEMVLLGVTAVRLGGLHGLHRELLWNGEDMEFTNISENDKIKIPNENYVYNDETLRFGRQFAEFNAKEMAKEWIKHTYENGFSLPDMPKD